MKTYETALVTDAAGTELRPAVAHVFGDGESAVHTYPDGRFCDFCRGTFSFLKKGTRG